MSVKSEILKKYGVEKDSATKNAEIFKKYGIDKNTPDNIVRPSGVVAPKTPAVTTKTNRTAVGLAAESGYTQQKAEQQQTANRQTVKDWWKHEQQKAAEDDSTERARTAKITGGANIDNSKDFLANTKKNFSGFRDDADTQRKRAMQSKMGVGANWGNPKTAVGNAVESAAAGTTASLLNAMGTVLRDDGKRQGLAVDSGDIEATETDTWHNRWGKYLQGEADKVQKISEDAYTRGSDGLTNAQRLLFNVGIAGAQMLGDKAFGAAAPIVMAARGFGSGSMQARQEGGSHTEQIAYGSLGAALEVLTEKMFDGVAHVYGKGAADDVVQKVAEKLAKTPQGQSVVRALMNAGGEGLEEMVSAIVDPALQTIYNDKTINGRRYGEKGAYDDVTIADILYDGLVGTLLGFAGGSVDVAQTMRSGESVSGQAQGAEGNKKSGSINQELDMGKNPPQLRPKAPLDSVASTNNSAPDPELGVKNPAAANPAKNESAAPAQRAVESAAPVRQEETETPRLLTPEEQTAKRNDEEVERIIEAFTTDDGYVGKQKQNLLIHYHGEDLFYRAVREAFGRGLITNDGRGNLYSLKVENRAPGYYNGDGSKEAKYLDNLAKAANMTIIRGELEDGQMGFYINGRAVLAKDAGVEIARHEVAHHLKQAAPEEFNAFLDYVKGTYGEQVDTALEVIRSDYAERGEALSDAVAEEELAAYYAGQLMTDETAMKRLAGENLSLSERLLSWLKESLAKIRRAFGGESVEAKQLREATELFEKAIRAAKEGAVTTDGVRHAYAGQGAKTADVSRLQNAQQMEERGADAETIRKETGWFKGMDGKWRFEIDDSGAVYKRSGDAKYARDPEYLEYNELWEKAYGYGKASEAELARLRELDAKYSRITQQSSANLKNGNATLEDVLQHDELFAAYPELRDVKVVFAELGEGTRGSYNSNSNTIRLDESLRNKPDSTLLHEIQHVIQQIEGFSGGASPEYWAGQKSVGFSMRQNDRRIMAAEKEYRKIWNSAPEEMKNLVRARNRATLAKDWGAVLTIEDQLYESEYSELFSKLDMADFVRRGDRGEELTPSELYRNTAGEIEARDVASRRNLNEAQRKEKTPDLGDENTVFADGDAGWTLEADDETTSIKEQIAKHEGELNEMSVVASAVVPTNIQSKDKAADWAAEQLKKTGYHVDRQGYGEIFFSKKDIDKGLRYADTPAERAAIIALPQVLKRGIEVGQHGNHKGRSKQTITFAAPVELNDVRGNMAVVVNRNGNHYYAHRIVLPDGTEFRFSENKNNTAQELSRGVTIDGSLADTTSAVSTNSITSSAEKDNTKNADRRSAYEGTAEKLDELQRLQRQNERLNKMISALEHEVRLEKAGGTTDREATKKLAKDIVKRYSSKVDVDALTGRMVDLFDRTMRNELSQAEMKEAAREIARFVLDGSVAQTNPMYEEYEDLRKELRGTKLKLEPEDRADLDRVDGYENFRKRNMGKFILSNNGVSVDAVYEGLSERYPTLFPDDIYAPADQLIQIADALDEMKPVMGNPFEGETGAAEFLANDVLESYFDIPTTRTAEIQRMRTQFERQRRADREATDRRFENSRKRQRERIDKIMQKNAEREQERRAKATASERREQLMKGTERLTKKLVRPDDKRHIPAEMRETVRAFVSMVNTESGYEYVFQRDGTYKRVKAGSDPHGVSTARTDRARELQAQLRKLEEDGGASIDPNLQANLDAIAEMEETKIADMNRQQLDLVYETMRAIEKMAQNYDKMLGESKYATVSKAAEALRAETAGRGAKTQYKGALQAVDDLAELDMMTPETFFHKMGRAGDELFRQMRRSADKQTQILKEGIEHAKSAIAKSKLDIKALEHETHEFELESGEHLTMTTAQIMNLHEAWKREQARDHIGLGGIKPTKIESGKGLKATAAVISEKVTLNDLANILKVLTPEQKALVDDLQKFMSGDLARHGNEASRETYGYDKFTEPDYWPIAVNKAEVESDPAKAAQAKTIVGFGMAKATKPKASNGLEIGSFMDVYTKHLSEMATYAGWLATSENLTRVNNFKFTDAEGKPTGQTVKTILEKLYGKGGDAYWQKLMGDIAQGTKTGSDGTIMDKVTGNTKAAAVGANIRVVLQQPTSILRAMNMVHPKYFTKKGAAAAGKGWEKALQYSGIAQWKDWGYFEMDTGRSVRGLITGPESKVEQLREKSMAAAGKADSVSWGILWNAVENETKDRHPELNGEALYEATAERFGEVIDRTQVVDSVLHRSQIMRKGGLNKMATSFMSEPSKVYNMVLRDIYDVSAAEDGKAKDRAKKKLVRTVGTLTLSFAANAVAQSIVDAMRDDDREKEYWEKFATNWAENFADNFNALNYIPYVKDIVSVFSGYDVSRMDMDAIADAKQAADQLAKAIKGTGKKTVANAGMDAANEIAAIFGLPTANIKRDLLAAVNTVFSEARLYRMQYELDKVLYNIDYTGSRVRWWKILHAASKDNWEDYVAIYNDMIARGIPEETIKKGMENQMKADAGVSSVKELPYRWTPPTARSEFNHFSKQISETEGPKKALDIGWW